jgi:hypothetical protein
MKIKYYRYREELTYTFTEWKYVNLTGKTDREAEYYFRALESAKICVENFRGLQWEKIDPMDVPIFTIETDINKFKREAKIALEKVKQLEKILCD